MGQHFPILGMAGEIVSQSVSFGQCAACRLHLAVKPCPYYKPNSMRIQYEFTDPV